MNLFQNPSWLSEFALDYDHFEDVPQSVFDDINEHLDRVQSSRPLVSILIAAYNEEINILRCVASLSRMQTQLPFEIIVINNNSADKTQQTLDKLHIKTRFQGRQGWGPARQMGQENAAGTYILLGDADCLYPPCWVDDMMAVLQRPGVACVYGRYAFISQPGFPRWQLALLEQMKDLITEFRHLYRPYFNAFGISMGYVKEHGLKAGFIMTRTRGEDGRMCLDLMAYGTVKQVRSNRARAWTGPRALQRSGSFSQALLERIKREVVRFPSNFRPHAPTDLNDPKYAKK